jgi:hypothetical protein
MNGETHRVGDRIAKINFNTPLYIVHLIWAAVSVIEQCWVNINRGWETFRDSIRFEVFAAVTMKNATFWDVTLCGSCKNRRFGGM